MPIDITIKYARLPHGITYFYQHWIPRNPRALVVFVHGLGDHIGRYQVFASRLTQLHFACALFDARGHGRSEGRRGHVERFSDWVSDLASFVHFSQNAVPPDTPIIIVGYSLGALIGVNFLLTHSAPVTGMVALSAAILPTIRIPRWKQKLVRKLEIAMPAFSFDNGVRFSDLTNDEAELESLKRDRLFHRRLTVSSALEINRNLEIVMAMPHRIHIPMLVLAGSEDSVCDPSGSRQFVSRLSSRDKACTVYDGMQHDLLHDAARAEVMRDIESWLLDRAYKPDFFQKQFELHRRDTVWENVPPPLQSL